MANDLWRTPPQVFKYYDDDCNFVCDVTASAENHLVECYMDEDDDMLSTDWLDFGIEEGQFVWCNPPYSNPLPFVSKCLSEAENNGIGSVMLLNHDMSVEWSALLATSGCFIEVFIAEGSKEKGSKDPYRNGRVSFLDEDGEPIGSNNKAQFAVIIPPWVPRPGLPETVYTSLKSIMSAANAK
jgi:phage N-6-adenine-methyltransferase